VDIHTLRVRNRGTVSERLRTACDLLTAGVELQRQRLRRALPDAPPTEIDRLINQWLRDRPGANRGDGPQPLSK